MHQGVTASEQKGDQFNCATSVQQKNCHMYTWSRPKPAWAEQTVTQITW